MAEKVKSEGFGFVREDTEHHFLVIIPSAKKEEVLIGEYFQWEDNPARIEASISVGKESSRIRAILPFNKWEAIAEEVKIEFNRRLQKNGLRQGQWKTGHNPVSRLFGKELVLLAWAIEDADPALIPVAIKNWLGLKPEERWWLYTMTNAATGHAVYGRNKGWRKAVRYALTENPTPDVTPTPTFDFFNLDEKDKVWSA